MSYESVKHIVERLKCDLIIMRAWPKSQLPSSTEVLFVIALASILNVLLFFCIYAFFIG